MIRKSRILAIVLGIALTSVGCGRSTLRINSQKQVTNSSSNLAMALTCMVNRSGAGASGFSDSSGNFPPNYQAPLVSYVVQATRGGMPVDFRIADVALDENALAIQSPIPGRNGAPVGVQIRSRNNNNGVYPIRFQIVDAETGRESGSCQSEYHYSVVASSEPRVLLTANGQEIALTEALPHRSAAFIRLQAINVSRCDLELDGVPVPGSGIYAEFWTPELLHSGPTTAPKEFIYTARCMSAQNIPIVKSVTIRVNPPASLELYADGVRGPKVVLLGASVTLSWQARFVSQCELNDGQRVFNVEPQASIRVENIQRDGVFRLRCADGSPLGMESSVAVSVVQPSVQLAIQGRAEREIVVPTREAVTLVWQSQFVTNCTFGEAGAMAPVAPAGTVTVTARPGIQDLAVACQGPGQTPVVSSLIRIRGLNPQVTITVNGVSGANYLLPVGANAVVAWNGQDVTGCRDPFGGNLVTGNRELQRSALSANPVFTLTCDTPFQSTITVSIQVMVGGWYQADNQACDTVCRSRGLTNQPSPEGMYCVSGENRATSASGVITYNKGCWNSCAPTNTAGAISVGGSCYHPTQKRDWDRTDQTQGCYCG